MAAGDHARLRLERRHNALPVALHLDVLSPVEQLPAPGGGLGRETRVRTARQYLTG